MKETNAQKIKRYYNISKMQTKYKPLVLRHHSKQLSDAEFLFECDKLYNRSWRSCFISLKEVRDAGIK